MNKFKKPYGSRPEGRPKFNPKFSKGASASRRPRAGAGGGYQGAVQKFDAVCSNCGKACQVPFRPDGKNPVYCKNCFDAPRSAFPALKRHASAGVAPSGEGKSIADLTRQIAAMNAKIDTMLKILEEGA